MKPVFVVAIIIVTVLGAGRGLTATQARIDLPPAERVEVPRDGVTVSTKAIGGRPTVEVTINGRGPFPMIVDTGASVTVIDDTLATELALPRAPLDVPAEMGPGPVRIDELRVGEAVLHGMTVGQAPSLFGSGATSSRGVLSAAAFPGHLLTIDYPHATLRLEPGALPAADDHRVFEYGADEVLPVVPVTVAGQVIRVHLDSGSPSGLILPMKYESTIPLAGAPVVSGHARTPAGEFEIQRAPFSGDVSIGAFPIELAAISFSDLRPGGGGPGIGNVGAQVLQEFVITLDTAHRRVRFARVANR